MIILANIVIRLHVTNCRFKSSSFRNDQRRQWCRVVDNLCLPPLLLEYHYRRMYRTPSLLIAYYCVSVIFVYSYVVPFRASYNPGSGVTTINTNTPQSNPPQPGTKHVCCGHCRKWLLVPIAANLIFCPNCERVNNCALR